jgi:hypothetical protein
VQSDGGGKFAESGEGGGGEIATRTFTTTPYAKFPFTVFVFSMQMHTA